jgi:quercetin dioxygenase-like cupin family protein
MAKTPYLYRSQAQKMENKGSSNNYEVEKGSQHIVTEIIEYLADSVVSKRILSKVTGSITASALDIGTQIEERISHFDNYIQIIDGTAELTIDIKKYQLSKGQGIIIPANSNYIFNANMQFKMISTIIKSGYED